LQDNLRDPAVGRDSFRRSLKLFFVCVVRTNACNTLEVLWQRATRIYFLLTYLLTYLSKETTLHSVLGHG